MKDRIPTYPGRVRLIPVEGQENIYDMSWADGAVEPGTDLSKANLLTDATATLLGLDPTENPTVNDALNRAAGTVTFVNAWNGAEVEKDTDISDLSTARTMLAGASTSDHALFAGGINASAAASDVVEAYNANKVRSSFAALDHAAAYMTGVSLDGKALFGGGITYSGATITPQAYVTAYTDAGVKTALTNLDSARYQMGGASVGDYALFAGGYDGSVGVATVDAYNSSLVKTTCPDMANVGCYRMGSASTGRHAVFLVSMVTWSGTPMLLSTPVAVAYDASLVLVDFDGDGQGRCDPAGCSIDGKAVFAGGSNEDGTTVYADVDIYNTAGTLVSTKALNVARTNLAAADNGVVGIFAGGKTTSADSPAVNIIQGDGVITNADDGLGTARSMLAGASVGDEIIFAGGVSGGTLPIPTDDVDDYHLQHTFDITIPAFSLVEYGDEKFYTTEDYDFHVSDAFSGTIRRGSMTLSGKIVNGGSYT